MTDPRAVLDSDLRRALAKWSEDHDEEVAAALEAEDVRALADKALLEAEDAEAIFASLRRARPRIDKAGLEALDAFLAPPRALKLVPGSAPDETPEPAPLPDPAPSARRPPRAGWARRLAVLAPAAAVLLMVGLGTSQLAQRTAATRPDLPAFEIEPLALGQRTTKGASEAPGAAGLKTKAEAPIVWGEGITFHVRLVPALPSAIPVTAQAFLRTAGETQAFPLLTEERSDGVHVHGVLGREVSLPPAGAYELVLVVTPASHPVALEDVDGWARGDESGSGRELFWYDVEVR
ncbi:MAG: hypothetical protein AAFZ18_35075 [Myxococcota bacterium]